MVCVHNKALSYSGRRENSFHYLFWVDMIAEVSGDIRLGSEVKVQVSDAELLWAYFCLASERKKVCELWEEICQVHKTRLSIILKEV